MGNNGTFKTSPTPKINISPQHQNNTTFSKITPLLKNNISPQHQNNATFSKITPLQKIRIIPPNNIPLHNYYVSVHVRHIQLIKENINYVCTVLFSPAVSTFLTVITLGYSATFQNLTTVSIKTKYVTKNVFNTKCHLDQQYKYSRSTSKIKNKFH